MELHSEIEAGITIVSVQATRIDAAAALAFKDGLRTAAQDAPAVVILDLTQVTFIDSSGLGAIVASMKLSAHKTPLVLAGLMPTVQKVFKLTRMDQVFDLFETRQQALDVLGDKKAKPEQNARTVIDALWCR